MARRTRPVGPRRNGGFMSSHLLSVVVGVFWACAALVVYAYAGYPLLAWLLSRWFGREAGPPVLADAKLPVLSLLIAAHNEEAVIDGRLGNALACDYPPGKLDVAVGSDGSTDATASIVRRYAGRGVRLFHYADRGGKSAVLNASFPRLRGTVVMLSDANTHFDPQAARHLARWFDDPQVGVVVGRLILVDPDTGRNADSHYWRYETFLKQCEGRLGALLGANGAIYAIRRELFEPIPAGTLVDDFVLPLRAVLRTGCRVVYDDCAIAREETAAEVADEFRRRSRIGAGGFQSLGMLWRLLDPRRGWIAFTFLSHKIVRWFCPFFLLGMLLSSLLLWHRPFYRAALLTQLAGLGLSVLAHYLPPRWTLLKPLRLLTMFTTMNLALLVGFGRWLCGVQSGVWRRTARAVSPELNVR